MVPPLVLLFGNHPPFFVARIVIIVLATADRVVVLRDAIVSSSSSFWIGNFSLSKEMPIQTRLYNKKKREDRQRLLGKGEVVSKRRSAVTRKGGLDDDDANDANDDKRSFKSVSK